MIGPSHPISPPCQEHRVSLAAGKSDAELEPVFFCNKALAEAAAHMARACAIVD